jgi:ketosteroid isomerase-like protein
MKIRTIAVSAGFVGALACASCGAQATPTQAFLAYHDAVLKAHSAEDLAPVLAKADRDKIKIAPPKAKEFFFGIHQDVARVIVGPPKVLTETIQGDKATLDAEAVCDYTKDLPQLGKKPCRATVTLIKESDGWKVTDVPNWQMK